LSAGVAFDLLSADAAEAEPDGSFLDFLAEEEVEANVEGAGVVGAAVFVPPPVLLPAELELPDLVVFSLPFCFLALFVTSLPLPKLPPDLGTSARLILSLGSEEPPGVVAAAAAPAADRLDDTGVSTAACDSVLLVTGVEGG